MCSKLRIQWVTLVLFLLPISFFPLLQIDYQFSTVEAQSPYPPPTSEELSTELQTPYPPPDQGDQPPLIQLPYPPPASGDGPLQIEDPLIDDAKVYASGYNISLDEAIEQLKLQDVIGELNAQLTMGETDTFAGLWVQHQPYYRVIVRFTNNGETSLHEYVKDSPLANLIDILRADVNLTELEETRSQADQMITKLGISVGSGINVKEN